MSAQGEAARLGVDGISDFDGLYSGQHNDEIQLDAFDILALDGDDLRKLPLARPTSPASLLGVPTASTWRPFGLQTSTESQKDAAGLQGPAISPRASKVRELVNTLAALLSTDRKPEPRAWPGKN